MHFDIKLGKAYTNTERPAVGEILADINYRVHQSSYAIQAVGIAAGVSLLLLWISSWWVALLVIASGIGLGGWLEYQQRQRRLTTLHYQCDNEFQLRFAAVQHACEVLARTEKIWLEAKRKSLQRRQAYAGASQVIQLSNTPVKVCCTQPPFIQTNLSVWSIDVGHLTLFFLPDYILVWRRKVYSAVSYSALSLDCDRQQINLTSDVPKDAQLIGETWQYVTPDGKPDPAAKSNQKIFQVQYGLLRLMASVGFNIRLHVSSVLVAEQFIKSFASVQQWLSPRRSFEFEWDAPPALPKDEYGLDERRSPYDILGIQLGAPLSEVRAAYHKAARLNHPDKVIGLAPEFQQLAEHRMKVITDAYRKLTEQHASIR
ncbi:MAG: DnaJ family molecular chaperone [Elainellaceae cyanobacterium]